MGVLSLLYLPVSLLLRLVENGLYILINWYDAYCYSPLQTWLSPLVAKVPRTIRVQGNDVTVFSANIVSWARTALVIPVAWCLKYEYCVTAFLLVLVHDFLDHLDGIVAKVQKKMYGPVDDPILGSFTDAFCDKIVNVLSLWTILMVTDFSRMSQQQALLFFCPCAVIIGYEFILGVVRVQDYFRAFYTRKYRDEASSSPPNLAAVMEGKLKEKLESLGIGFLCLAQAYPVAVTSTAGLAGTVCLVLSVRLAHASLQHKLKARRQEPPTRDPPVADDSTLEAGNTTSSAKISVSVQVNLQEDGEEILHVVVGDREGGSESDVSSEDEKSDVSEKEDEVRRPRLRRSKSVPNWDLAAMTTRVDKVYTVGCFDLFHEGHVKLLMRLKTLGRQVVVGVHDSRSIYKLKKRVPIDDTGKRMANVKKHADIVFCVHGTDPTPYLSCIFDDQEKCTSMYVRGDDMPNFPARELTERLMPIKFLPYTKHVSSTKIRKDVYNASKFGPHANYSEYDLFY